MSIRWLAVRLELLGNILTFLAAIFCIVAPDRVNPSEVGLIISYSLSVTQVLNWLVRNTSDLESNVVAVERIREYTNDIEAEDDWVKQEVHLDEEWPDKGVIQFEQFAMRYRQVRFDSEFFLLGLKLPE